MTLIRFKRGTTANVNAHAAANGFQPGEPVYLTDTERFGIAIANNAYVSVPNIVRLTAAQYAALSPPNPNTFYVVIG